MSDIFSAPHDVFRASMVGNASMAGATPRRQDASSAHSGGNEGGRICDGCDSGAPCPSCAGDFDAPHATTIAFEWANLTHRERPMEAMWRLAFVADEVRRADDDSEQSERMLRFLSSIAGEALGVSQFDLGRGIPSWFRFELPPPPSQELVSEVLSDVGASVYTTPDVPYFNVLGECCPLTLKYPKGKVAIVPDSKTYEYSPPGGGPTVDGRFISVFFRTVAEFRQSPPNSDRFPLCDCQCCYFRQIILVNYVRYWGGPPGPGDDPGTSDGVSGDDLSGGSRSSKSAEDGCLFMIKSGGGKTTKLVLRPGEVPKNPDGTTMSPSQYYGPYCYGNHNNPPPPPDGETIGVGYSTPSPGKENCLFAATDKPGQFIPSTANRFRWVWLSLGQIRDRCNLDVVRKQGLLWFDISGSMNSDGVTFDDVGGELGRQGGTDWHAPVEHDEGSDVR